jgi:hypothetical protein
MVTSIHFNSIFSEMLRDGIPLEPMSYMAYTFGPPELWPLDWEAVLPGIFRKTSDEDRVGQIIGSS